MGSSTWSERIADAIASNRLIFYYQIIVGEQTLYEVLARLQEPSGEVIPAAKWFDSATPEQIKTIDRLAIIATLQHLELSHVIHSINLSGYTLNDATFPMWLSEQLDQSRANPRQLWIECTEQVALQMPSTRVLAALRDLDLLVGLDDFGTGAATIPTILEISPDFLKVAGSIVRLLCKDHWRECVVFGAMAIAYRKDIPLILEHVENGLIVTRALTLARHFPRLQLLFQGHHYSTAVPFMKP